MEPGRKHPKEPGKGNPGNSDREKDLDPPQIEEATGRRLVAQKDRQKGEERKNVQADQKARNEQADEPNDKGL